MEISHCPSLSLTGASTATDNITQCGCESASNEVASVASDADNSGAVLAALTLPARSHCRLGYAALPSTVPASSITDCVQHRFGWLLRHNRRSRYSRRSRPPVSRAPVSRPPVSVDNGRRAGLQPECLSQRIAPAAAAAANSSSGGGGGSRKRCRVLGTRTISAVADGGGSGGGGDDEADQLVCLRRQLQLRRAIGQCRQRVVDEQLQLLAARNCRDAALKQLLHHQHQQLPPSSSAAAAAAAGRASGRPSTHQHHQQQQQAMSRAHQQLLADVSRLPEEVYQSPYFMALRCDDDDDDYDAHADGDGGGGGDIGTCFSSGATIRHHLHTSTSGHTPDRVAIGSCDAWLYSDGVGGAADTYSGAGAAGRRHLRRYRLRCLSQRVQLLQHQLLERQLRRQLMQCERQRAEDEYLWRRRLALLFTDGQVQALRDRWRQTGLWRSDSPWEWQARTSSASSAGGGGGGSAATAGWSLQDYRATIELRAHCTARGFNYLLNTLGYPLPSMFATRSAAHCAKYPQVAALYRRLCAHKQVSFDRPSAAGGGDNELGAGEYDAEVAERLRQLQKEAEMAVMQEEVTRAVESVEGGSLARVIQWGGSVTPLAAAPPAPSPPPDRQLAWLPPPSAPAVTPECERECVSRSCRRLPVDFSCDSGEADVQSTVQLGSYCCDQVHQVPADCQEDVSAATDLDHHSASASSSAVLPETAAVVTEPLLTLSSSSVGSAHKWI